jgi:ribosome-associated toxin RatA of RatAB toxin-antitoxin module
VPRLEVEATVAGRDPAAIVDALADFESYVGHSDTIRSIEVKESEGAEIVSEWEVEFRGGVIAWSERDVVDRDAGEIRFSQIEGDSDVWEGSWRVEARDGACDVTYSVEYDMGIPSLADQLNPLAAGALYEVVTAVVGGMFGDDAEIRTPRPGG